LSATKTKKRDEAFSYNGKYCSMYKEYSKESASGKVYNKRDIVGSVRYEYRAGDELNQKGNIVRNTFSEELNKNIKEIFVLTKENINPSKEVESLEDNAPEETSEEFLASSICGLVNAIIEIPKAKILNMYYRDGRIHIDWEMGDSKKQRTSSNPLKIKR